MVTPTIAYINFSPKSVGILDTKGIENHNNNNNSVYISHQGGAVVQRVRHLGL